MLLPFILALLLGLRHATDPDHLTAVSTLLLGQRRTAPKDAGLLGLAWGMGHATTLFAFGLPVILFGRYLPTYVHQAAEALVGALIMVLCVRLLIRWHRGYYHFHIHAHGSVQHAHPHVHEHPHPPGEHPQHAHRHGEDLGRTPLASFGIGLIHGVGGSAGAGVLLVGSLGGTSEAVVVLLVFAAGTALSMAALSIGLAYALSQANLRLRLANVIPFLGAAGVLFGVWYSLGALGTFSS